MKIVGIYSIVNKLNNKLYVGYTTNFKERSRQHLNTLRLGCHDNPHIQNVYNKYGNIFEIEMIEECNEDLLCSLEHYWANILSSHDRNFGYNILPTHPVGKHKSHSEETKLKISIARKGQRNSEETKAKIAKTQSGQVSPMKGKHFSQKAVENMRNARKGWINPRKGIKLTDEQKINFRPNSGSFVKGYKMSKESRIKSDISHQKPITIFLGEKEIYKPYSIKEAEEYLGASCSPYIIACLKGRKQNYKSYTFKYGH